MQHPGECGRGYSIMSRYRNTELIVAGSTLHVGGCRTAGCCCWCAVGVRGFARFEGRHAKLLLFLQL